MDQRVLTDCFFFLIEKWPSASGTTARGLKRKENVSFFPFLLGFVARVLDLTAVAAKRPQSKTTTTTKQAN